MCGNRSNRLAWFVVPSRLREMMRAQYCYQCSPSSVKAFAAKFMFERSNATRTSQLAGRPCLEITLWSGGTSSLWRLQRWPAGADFGKCENAMGLTSDSLDQFIYKKRWMYFQ